MVHGDLGAVSFVGGEERSFTMRVVSISVLYCRSSCHGRSPVKNITLQPTGPLPYLTRQVGLNSSCGVWIQVQSRLSGRKDKSVASVSDEAGW